MPSFVNKILLSLLLVLSSTITHATLITNGSFEQTTFDDNSISIGSVFSTNLHAYENKKRAWDVFFRLPGWETTYGNGIELQKNIVTRSQNGSHHIELDSHPRGASNAVMTQTLKSLIVGADYQLDFYYKPRTRKKNDNGINVFWYDSAIDFNFDMKAVLVADSTRRLTPHWTLQSVLFTAQAQSMSLSFASFGKQNTLGGLIDNVSLQQVTPVPEPSTYIIFLMAIALLIFSQQKKHIN